MIIKGASKNNINYKRWGISIFVLSALVAVLYVVGSKNKKSTYSKRDYLSNAESVVDDSFENDGNLFLNGATQSSERAFSGKFSSKVDPVNRYGLGFQLDSLLPGDYVVVSIWLYGSLNDCYLAMHSNKESDIFYQGKKIVEEKDGWSKIEYEMRVPVKPLVNSLRIFAYFHAMEGEAFFDDLTIKINDTNTFYDKTTQDLPSLNLYLDDQGYSKINAHREKAMEDGILITDKDSWIKGKLTIEDSLEYEVDLRLKGDWTDHLEGKKWSFRIKMPDESSWNGMTEFSLQNPNTRGLLNEWVFHKLLQREDVLTTRYDFAKLMLNGQDLGIYAFEEHLVKQLPESNNRREGVVLRYSEAEFWNQRLQASKDGYKRERLESLELNKANIEAFNESKVRNNPVLMEQLNKASELLYQFQHKQGNVEEIFDLDRMARLYAIVDIMESYHGLIWHNQRFYYNPITRKLEPIGFDGYTGMGSMALGHKPYYGAFMSSKNPNDNYNINSLIFANKKFNRLYAHYLNLYCNEEYVDGFYEDYLEQLRYREDLLQDEFTNYTFDVNKLRVRARQIQNDVKPKLNQSLKAFKNNCTNDSCAVVVTNNHFIPLEIIGSSIHSGQRVKLLEEKLFVYENIPNNPPIFNHLNIPSNHKFLAYKVAGLDSTYYTEIKTAAAPSFVNITAMQETKLEIPLSDDNYIIENKEIVILAGNYKLTSPIIIPNRYTLRVSEGTNIDLSNGAYILVYGRVSLLGSADAPIKITGNKDNQGVVIMGGEGRSTIRHSHFSGLSNLSENEWQLTGAVTLYETDVDIVNSSFIENNCEDALNIIRSNFSLNTVSIHHTLFDGLDADFCTGSVVNCVMHDTGNDALDFSGSTVQITSTKINDPGDKGVSAGEKSTIRINDVSIDGADIAVAAKDLSTVTINDIRISNCNKGFTAYRKKPEFGGARINVGLYSFENVQHLTLTDDESSIGLPAATNVSQ